MFEDSFSKEGSKTVPDMNETLIGLPKNDSFEMHYKFGLCMTGAGL